ncbi:NACHT domain-containing protein [Streptomyces olivaceus]
MTVSEKRKANPLGPEPAGAWAHFWFEVSWPFVSLCRKGRNRWLIKRGDRWARQWWRPRTWLVNAAYVALTALYVAVIVFSFVQPEKNLLGSWQGVLTALGLSSTAVVAAVWFIFWRFRRTRRYYLRKARLHPEELVRPGSIIRDVVGRDQLCDALMNDLHVSDQRRPHVIVGTIGVGKTALLVRLTQRLAQKGGVPVVLQLRDVKERLNFSKLAREKFCDEVLERVASPAEAEKVWQRLRYGQDRVVVLADGLEDVLKGADDRDNEIRKAINDAMEAKLPLVITSRPQKSLEAIDAAQTVLEPLSEEAALRYVAEGSTWRSDRQRLDWVVEAAEIAESPLYLNIAKDLERCDRLQPVVGGGEDQQCDPRDQDAWALRYDLLEAWVQALVDGALHPEQPLSARGRCMTVEYLSALACAALRANSTYVGYEVLTGKAARIGTSGAEEESADAALVRKALRGRLQERLRLPENRAGSHGGAKVNMDERLAGSWGCRLGLVEELEDGVRFQHSVLQAYLASRYMNVLVRSPASSPAPRPEPAAVAVLAPEWMRAGPDPSAPATGDVKDAYFRQALRRPGRELAMALVFYSRSTDALSGCQGQQRSDEDESDCVCPISTVREELLEAAKGALQDDAGRLAAGNDDVMSNDVEQDPMIRALELYAAALDVDSFHHRPRHRDIVKEISKAWNRLQAYNDRKLDPPKKALIKRIGATGQLLSRRRSLPPPGLREGPGEPAYDILFGMARDEPSHGVRFAIAQAVGAGGDEAFRMLERELTPAPADSQASDLSARSPLAFTMENVDHIFQSIAQGLGMPGEGRVPDPFRDTDGPPSAPGTTRTERLLRKGRKEVLDKNRNAQETEEQREREEEEKDQRERIMKAWLAPMLVHSCSYTPHRHTPYELLSQWMELMRERDRGVDLETQVALAQGFRQAANHRTPSTQSQRAPTFLSEQAWEMLKHTHYWFAQLVLLHALTLWALPDDVTQQQPRRGHGASPSRQIRQWLQQTDDPNSRRRRREEHPLVKAAGKMAREALQTRRPDRFLWIDEADTAAQIGSEISPPRESRKHNLWIPPSRGWSTLDPGAQQLLADVLVLLVLTEQRGDRPTNARLRLEHAYAGEQRHLPPCMTRDRTPLHPMQAFAGEAPSSLPGSQCVAGCAFEFCPYPPKGPQFRTELNELFCIHQYSMLNRPQFQAWRSLRFRRRAPWQRGATVANLRRFWDEMGARARNRSLKRASSTGEPDE